MNIIAMSCVKGNDKVHRLLYLFRLRWGQAKVRKGLLEEMEPELMVKDGREVVISK